MPFKKLQIKQVSNSGEVISVVDCFAGQLSVFRAASDAAISPYRRALSGTPGQERFVIALDGADYDPGAHDLIGFGESFLGEPGSPTVLLLQSGVPAASIESVLTAHGLERAAHGPCDKLTRCEERRLRLLAATYSRDKLLVTDDPLEPLAMEWRERFAQMLVAHARAGHIVVVTSSSVRPSYWIDNDSVARVQVGEVVEKTIGFKAGARRATAILNQFRDMLKHDASLGPLMKTIEDTTAGKRPEFLQTRSEEAEDENGKARTFTPLTAVTAKPIDRVRRSRKRAAIAAAVVVSMGGAAVLAGKAPPSGEPSGTAAPKSMLEIARENTAKAQQVALRLPKKSQDQDGGPSPGEAATAEPSAVEEKAMSPAAQQPPVIEVALALDRYSPEIKRSILATYEGSNAPVAKRPRSAAAPTAAPERRAGRTDTLDLLKSLESASGTGDASKGAYTPPDPHNPYTQRIVNAAIEAAPPPYESVDDPMDTVAEQQKRELIRQKFLDAIDRAARKSSNE